MGFKDSSMNISTSSLVILAASLVKYLADKQTDRQTEVKLYPATTVGVSIIVVKFVARMQ